MNLQKLLGYIEQAQWKKRDIPPLKGPILTREMLQDMPLPPDGFISRTSGSTGIPVTVKRTQLSKLWYDATNIREVLWHKRVLSESFAVIRPNILEEVSEPTWGPAFSLIGKTGPAYGHPAKGDLNAWLQKIQPGYLFTYPSILETIDLASLSNLKGIKTTGEALSYSHPLIADMYSAEEVGTIAIQCPDNAEVYHVMENIVVEILDENDLPAKRGRVVVTDLTSHYLHRYDIGDYAEEGVCHCGRGLQTIQRILGRKRNMVRLPDGTRHWPLVGSRAYRDVAPVRRYQAVQIDSSTIELRLQVDAPLTPDQERQIIGILQKAILYPFEVKITYLDQFPKGKFEEFINLYDQQNGKQVAKG